MALDARRRQKKAEKRNAKEKAKRKQLALRKAEDIGQRLARVAAAPILHCCTTQDLWDQGIAQVLVSRELADGRVAFSVFLVDRYCLGVKNSHADIRSKNEYYEMVYENVAQSGDLVMLKPAAARKLVEAAVDYAKSLGLSPHADYSRAHQIFGDIDAAASDREFEFGKDGKPFFISGPHDSTGRCHSIVNILNERCGPGGFDYVVHVPASSLGSAADLEMEEWEDDDPDDVIEGSATTDAPSLPVRLTASLRRMIFGNE